MSSSETMIARLRRPKGLFKSQKPFIEVDDDFLDFLDEIVVTLVYVERKRNFMQEDSGPSSESAYSSSMYLSHR